LSFSSPSGVINVSRANSPRFFSSSGFTAVQNPCYTGEK
jgi:hypothetical protein